MVASSGESTPYGDASARHLFKRDDPPLRGLGSPPYVAENHLGREGAYIPVHGVHNTLLSVPHIGVDHGGLPLPIGGGGSGGSGYDTMGSPGAQPYGSPIGSPANTGSPWAASSPSGCTDDLMTIAMPQGSALDKEQIAARLRAAAPTEYED